VRPTWTDVRNLTNDVWRELPKGVVGPFMNDRFDDVYGSIYALTGDDFSYEEKREYAETLRRQLMTIPEV
ncbi:RND transporter, HAE1/HME family, permease protein, partial [human gut metagenome]